MTPRRATIILIGLIFTAALVCAVSSADLYWSDEQDRDNPFARPRESTWVEGGEAVQRLEVRSSDPLLAALDGDDFQSVEWYDLPWKRELCLYCSGSPGPGRSVRDAAGAPRTGPAVQLVLDGQVVATATPEVAGDPGDEECAVAALVVRSGDLGSLYRVLMQRTDGEEQPTEQAPQPDAP